MFLHLWAIPIGAAVLILPVAIHFLTKPYPSRMKLSTVRFVLEIVNQRKARYRLRDWLILAMRTLAIALFALMIARPRNNGQAATPDNEPTSSVVKIVILDVSQSMGAVAQGIQSIERARPIAAKHVGYQSSTQANLILAAATPQSVFERPSTNFATLINEVAKATPLPQRLNTQNALNAAAEMFTHSGKADRHELVIVSDFQRSNWAAADFSVLPADAAIQLESVAPADTPANLAITRVSSPGRVERDRPFRLEVEIGNYSPATRQVTVEVTLGAVRLSVEGQCSAGGRSVLVAETRIPTEGWHTGEARLAGVDDGVNEDNRRPFVVQVHQQPTYLLLTRQSAEARPSSSYFVERAISSQAMKEGQIQEKIVRADPLRADRDLIATADLIALDHPGKLSEELLQLLASLLRRGRGVLYVAAEPIDATNIKLLSQAAGTSLQLPVEFLPVPAGQSRKNLFLSDVRRREMPFKVFGEEASAIVAPIRFHGGLNSRRLEGALLDDVLATFNDQSACLVVSACGAGTLAILNADLSSTNLTSSPVFVPMIGELTSHLLGRDRTYDAVASGESLAVYLPPAASPVAGLRIESSNSLADQESLGELHEENVGVMWQASSAGPPGIYQVKRAQQTVFALASAIPSEEADLVTLASDVMTERLSGGRHVKYRSAFDEEEQHDEIWTWLALTCLGCMCVEVLGLRLFKS